MKPTDIAEGAPIPDAGEFYILRDGKAVAGVVHHPRRVGYWMAVYPPADWRDDARSGLNIIATRAESLSRFMQAYARLARLPQPQMEAINLGELVKRVASLETRIAVRVVPGADVTVNGDAAQLEQLLINILHNAAEASLETASAGADVAVELGAQETRAMFRAWRSRAWPEWCAPSQSGAPPPA